MYLTLILGSAERSLWLLVYAAEIGLLLRLVQQGLHRRYRFFALYILAHIAESSALLLLKPGTNAYGWTYVAFVPVIALCSVLAVLEVYDLVLRDYRGIRSLGRWAVATGLAAALAVAAVTLAPDLGNPNEPYPLLLHAHVFQRALYSALLLFVLFITAFLLWFPLPLSRNTMLHTLVFAFNFAGATSWLLLRNVGGPERRLLSSTISLTIAAACLLAWIVFLTRHGEQRTVISGHRWRSGETHRLVEQLDALNSSLLRSARKR